MVTKNRRCCANHHAKNEAFCRPLASIWHLSKRSPWISNPPPSVQGKGSKSMVERIPSPMRTMAVVVNPDVLPRIVSRASVAFSKRPSSRGTGRLVGWENKTDPPPKCRWKRACRIWRLKFVASESGSIEATRSRIADSKAERPRNRLKNRVSVFKSI